MSSEPRIKWLRLNTAQHAMYQIYPGYLKPRLHATTRLYLLDLRPNFEL